MEAIDGSPQELIGHLPDDLPDAAVEIAFFRVEVEVGRDLPVDAERAAGAGVDEDLPVGVPGRIEVEPALGLPAGQVGADGADQETVVEALAAETRSQGVAKSGGSRPGGENRVVDLDLQPPEGRAAGQ